MFGRLDALLLPTKFLQGNAAGNIFCLNDMTQYDTMDIWRATTLTGRVSETPRILRTLITHHVP
jgi:hypothetical protein